jgi:predicted dehydrogenase
MIHARNLARRIDHARLVGICDSNESNLAAAAAEFGGAAISQDYRKALEQADVVAAVIVTPTFLHREVACFAAERGKHIFLEKPMALTVGECEEINAAVARAGVKLQIGFMRRFDEGFLRAKRMIESGEMGRVMIIKSTGRGPGGPGAWMYDLKKSNGIVAEVNSHDIDSLLWFTGLPIERVHAMGHNFKCPDARAEFPEFYDNVVANFGFTGGTMGVVDGTCPAHYGYDARVEILCEKGLLLIGSTQQQTATKVTLEGEIIGQAVKTWRNLFKDAYLAEIEHFVECVLVDKAPSVTGMDGLRATEAVVAVNQSITSGKMIELRRKAEA